MTALARTMETEAASTSAFADDVVSGLTSTPKRLSPKYFYDNAGSALFERITALPEYYPTRCEIDILKDHAKDIAALLPAGAALVEFGSGSSTKTRIVLSAATKLAAYVPVEISTEFLHAQMAGLRREYPKVAILPVAADFTKPFDLPEAARAMPRVGFFPGSTIGNFEPHEAAAFLRHAGRILGAGATFIVGVDLVKDTQVLKNAYNDAQGVTAKFNLNVLARINRQLGAKFDLAAFEHHAFFNRGRSRIEMHLASLKRQRVKVCGECIDFRAGETIHTESSYKYTLESFGALARGADWSPVAVWTDADNYFSVHALRFKGDSTAGGKAAP
ncbi:MAG TPA: L-histidine N(alpha)-methyltransferase [Xanthobacteraceae bacterium]|jgi:dimethylhistidine N-methyltransferase|nr:L-histidine N(alpha)-methyltransferase [Xanthobacteraceae bacterium]